MPRVPRGAHCGRPGQALVETALAFPLLLLVAVALVQFALYAHARHVVTGAVQDGARLAASYDRSIADGVGRAQSLLGAGLGPTAREVSLRGVDGGDLVTVEASGRLRTIIPWLGESALPLEARSVVSKERFRPVRGSP